VNDGGVGSLEDHSLVLLIVYRWAIPQYFMACLHQTNPSSISRFLKRIELQVARGVSVSRTIRVSHEEAHPQN